MRAPFGLALHIADQKRKAFVRRLGWFCGGTDQTRGKCDANRVKRMVVYRVFGCLAQMCALFLRGVKQGTRFVRKLRHMRWALSAPFWTCSRAV